MYIWGIQMFVRCSRNLHIFAYVHIHLHNFTHIHVHLRCSDVYSLKNLHTFTHIHVYYIYMYVCKCVQICTYLHTYMYIWSVHVFACCKRNLNTVLFTRELNNNELMSHIWTGMCENNRIPKQKVEFTRRSRSIHQRS